jgi:acyl-CoA reductase-like NAD-dependent aldehyde dehydrogenase
MDEAVVRLRTNFMKRAIQQVREMVAYGRIEEAHTAFQEVRRYFEWAWEGISPEERGPIFEQIQAIPGMLKAR